MADQNNEKAGIQTPNENLQSLDAPVQPSNAQSQESQAQAQPCSPEMQPTCEVSANQPKEQPSAQVPQPPAAEEQHAQVAQVAPNEPTAQPTSEQVSPQTVAQVPAQAVPAQMPSYGNAAQQQPSHVPVQPPQQPAAGFGQQVPPAQMPPQGPNFQQQMPPAPRPPKKKRVWPWVLLACAVALLMFIGGCVSGAALGFFAGSNSGIYITDAENALKGLSNNNGNGGNSANNGSSNGSSNSSNSGSSSSGSIKSNQKYTLDEIKKLADNARNQIESGNVATDGVYCVGSDISAGLYYLQGSPDTESSFYVFNKDDSTGKYELDASVAYTGNYYTELENDDVIVFLPKVDSARMMPATSNTQQPEAPYQSGLYRIGTDIPAGKYKVSVYENAPKSSTQEYAAYIMKDISFEDDSILSEVDLLKGQSREITVESGQWLELFGATATPVE